MSVGSRFESPESAQGNEPLRQPRQLPRGGILVNHAAGDSARQLRLGGLQSLGRLVLLARFERRLGGLDEGPDAAHPGAVDRLAIRVAADALLGLLGIRHLSLLISSSKKKAAQ